MLPTTARTIIIVIPPGTDIGISTNDTGSKKKARIVFIVWSRISLAEEL